MQRNGNDWGDTQDRGNEQPPHICCTGSTISGKGVSQGLFFPSRFLFSLQPCWEGLVFSLMDKAVFLLERILSRVRSSVWPSRMGPTTDSDL